MKYLVMECHSGYAVVLSDDGRFLKVANMRYEVGQTVTNIVEMCLPQLPEQPAKTNRRRWISSLSALAACLVLVITSIFFTGQMPYASVYLTINPEVRIDVNRTDVVVGVEGVNADGAELLEGYDYRRKNLDLVMDELVDRAIDMGYLHEGGEVTLTLDADDDQWIVTHSEELSTHLNEHLTDKITVTIDIEEKGAAATEESASGYSAVVPVEPDGYNESDYGETVPEETVHPTQNNRDDGQSDYDDSSDDDGQSNFDAPPDTNGESEYDGPARDDGEQEDDEGQSGYADSDDGDDSDEDSGYEE